MAGDTYPVFKAAAVQAPPAFLDREKTLGRVEDFVGRAASKGAELVAFGESFVPAFPLWNLVHRPIDQHRFFRRLYDNAVVVPGPQTKRLGEIARENRTHLSVGVTEKSALSVGTMWNTNLFFGPDGSLLNRHRKLVPTWAEKLTWANGDSSGLRVTHTAVGRVGALICGENTNTLARFELLRQGEQVHVSTYPPAWPFVPNRGKKYDLTDAIKIRSAGHSFEGKVFNVVASCLLDREAIETVAAGDGDVEAILEESPRAVSAIFGPTGAFLGEPLAGKEGVVVAELDLSEPILWKEVHDITGGYNRFDVFRFETAGGPQPTEESRPAQAESRGGRGRRGGRRSPKRG